MVFLGVLTESILSNCCCLSTRAGYACVIGSAGEQVRLESGSFRTVLTLFHGSFIHFWLLFDCTMGVTMTRPHDYDARRGFVTSWVFPRLGPTPRFPVAGLFPPRLDA
jgi:hypothetical protein